MQTLSTLNVARSNAINNAQHTHNYSKEALASYEATGNNKMDEMQARFEASIAQHYNTANDVGGLVEYYKDGKLVAFYDYENFTGAMLAVPL